MRVSAVFMRLLSVLPILFIGLVVLGIWGCQGKEKSDLPTAASLKVQAYLVVAKTQAALEEVPGTVRPKLKAAVEAKVSGRIEKMNVNEGQLVKEGELLAELDARELNARLDQALARLDESQRDLKRYTALIKQKSVTQAEFDTAQAKDRVAQAAVVETQTMLGYTKVAAPFSGVITRKVANVGDLSAPGRVLYEIEDPAVLRLEANVPEALIDNVKVGAAYEVKVSGLERTVNGVVVEISPAADPNSRTYLVKLNLPADATLRSGQFGRVAIPAQQALSIAVPQSAIVKRGQMEIVYVIDKGRAWLRLVRSGRRYGDLQEILAGLSDAESIVAKDADKLQDGQLVEVLQ